MMREEFNHHQEMIEAWINGAEIQFYSELFETWNDTKNPKWLLSVKYRIKPYGPEQGELVEVSPDGNAWFERRFISCEGKIYWTISENYSGYNLTTGTDGEPVIKMESWKHLRPLKK